MGRSQLISRRKPKKASRITAPMPHEVPDTPEQSGARAMNFIQRMMAQGKTVKDLPPRVLEGLLEDLVRANHPLAREWHTKFLRSHSLPRIAIRKPPPPKVGQPHTVLRLVSREGIPATMGGTHFHYAPASYGAGGGGGGGDASPRRGGLPGGVDLKTGRMVLSRAKVTGLTAGRRIPYQPVHRYQVFRPSFVALSSAPTAGYSNVLPPYMIKGPQPQQFVKPSPYTRDRPSLPVNLYTRPSLNSPIYAGSSHQQRGLPSIGVGGGGASSSRDFDPVTHTDEEPITEREQTEEPEQEPKRRRKMRSEPDQPMKLPDRPVLGYLDQVRMLEAARSAEQSAEAVEARKRNTPKEQLFNTGARAARTAAEMDGNEPLPVSKTYGPRKKRTLTMVPLEEQAAAGLPRPPNRPVPDTPMKLGPKTKIKRNKMQRVIPKPPNRPLPDTPNAPKRGRASLQEPLEAVKGGGGVNARPSVRGGGQAVLYAVPRGDTVSPAIGRGIPPASLDAAILDPLVGPARRRSAAQQAIRDMTADSTPAAAVMAEEETAAGSPPSTPSKKKKRESKKPIKYSPNKLGGSPKSASSPKKKMSVSEKARKLRMKKM